MPPGLPKGGGLRRGEAVDIHPARMSKLEDGRGELPKLPSVEMALLPHEVRAARARNALIAGSAVAMLIGGGVLAAVPQLLEWSKQVPGESHAAWPSEQGGSASPSVLVPSGDGGVAGPAITALAAIEDNAAPAEELEAMATEELVQAIVPATPEGLPGLQPPGAAMAADAVVDNRTVKSFGRARGFRDAVVRGGATGEDADAITEALGKLVNFRRCKPEDELTFERNGNGQLMGFEYRTSITERYRAERGMNGKFVGKQIEVPVEYRRIARGGYVSDSLGRAVEAVGLGSGLASALVEAFEGKIDFKKQTRAGDSFRLVVDEQIVEGKSLGYGPVLAVEYRGERCGTATAYWFAPTGEAGDFYDESGRALHGGWLRTPLRYDHISSPFDPKRRHPILKKVMPHHGVDYAAAPGTTVWAAADGVITFAGARGPNGNLVSIKHPGGYETHYAHLLRISRGMKPGVPVKQRQPIGAVGSTGRSTGPHLHFALKRSGKFIDPVKQLNGPGRPLSASHLPEFKKQVARLKRDLAATTLAAAPVPDGQRPSPGEVFHEDSLDL
jgi:murein DD-endopeptidase MepM/ murein hydrolase activator NlpD